MGNTNYEKEFEIINLILNCEYETRAVDAFALSLIKSERQLRKIFTYLIFQNPCFNDTNTREFRKVLAENKKINFKDLIECFNNVSPKMIRELIGDRYSCLNKELEKSKDYRDKIFHGQITIEGLDRNELLIKIEAIKEWCKELAESCNNEFGYDGFARNSFRKNTTKNLVARYKKSINSMEDYRRFLKDPVGFPAARDL